MLIFHNLFSSDDYIAIGADEEELGSQIEEDILWCISVCSRVGVFFENAVIVKLFNLIYILSGFYFIK